MQGDELFNIPVAHASEPFCGALQRSRKPSGSGYPSIAQLLTWRVKLVNVLKYLPSFINVLRFLCRNL